MVDFKRKYWYLLALFTLIIILSACTNALEEAETAIIPATSAAQETETVNISPTSTSVLQDPGTIDIPEISAEPAETVTESPVEMTCEPTAADMLGPFYEPGAPVRNAVGEGYELSGIVRSSNGCVPVPEAVIEFWLAGPDGAYADKYRATVIAENDGAYRFESHPPPPYSGRPPHIHVRVTAPGYQELVTQHYPQSDQTEAVFDLVLQP